MIFNWWKISLQIVIYIQCISLIWIQVDSFKSLSFNWTWLQINYRWILRISHILFTKLRDKIFYSSAVFWNFSPSWTMQLFIGLVIALHCKNIYTSLLNHFYIFLTKLQCKCQLMYTLCIVTDKTRKTDEKLAISNCLDIQ